MINMLPQKPGVCATTLVLTHAFNIASDLGTVFYTTDVLGFFSFKCVQS